MIFLKKYMEIRYFLHICINVINMIFSRKNTLKVIDILDRILERVPMILYTFMETFIGAFIYCFAVKEKQPGNLIYRIEVWLLLQFIWLEICYNEEYSIHCTIQTSGVVFRSALEHQLRKLFVHYEMDYKSKKIRAAVKIFSVQVNRTFLKVHAKYLVKVTRIGEVVGTKRSPTLRKLSFKIPY